MCSIIIVDYCSIEKTIKYIAHLQEYIVNIPEFHVIIVDNAENQNGLKLCNDFYGTGKYVELDIQGDIYVFQLDYGMVVYCHSGKNLGYAGGNNLGTEIADKLFKDKYYLISNNDLRIPEKIDWNKIERIFENEKNIAVIGPRVVGLDGKEQSPHKKITPFKQLIASYWIKYFPILWKNGDYDYTGESKVCYRVIGCFMFVKASAFCLADRFDPETFMYAEELILSERLKEKGYYFYFENSILVVHEHGASVKKTASVKKSETWSFESLCYYYKNYRNVSEMFIKIAQINFKVYIFLLPAILKLKQFKNRKNKK